MLALQQQRAVQHARGEIGLRASASLSLSTGKKPSSRHCGGQLRIDEQARGRRSSSARGVVDRLLAAAARDALPGAELELAGRVVASVADDAAPFEDGLHVLRYDIPATGWTGTSKRFGSGCP